MPVKKNLMTYCRLSVGAILLVTVFATVGPSDIYGVLKTVRMGPFLGLVVCLGTLYFLGAFNTWLLLNTLQPIPFFIFLRIYAVSWAMSLITPGQAGDASIILLMKKYKIPVSATSTAYLLDKSITLLLFLAISVYGVSILMNGSGVNYFSVGLCLLVLLLIVGILGILILHNSKWHLHLRNIFVTQFENLYILKRRWHAVVANVMLTIVKWLVVSFAFYLAFLSFDTKVSWPIIGVIPIMSTIVGYIPISLAGLGTVEITAVYFFSTVGVLKSVVVSSYLVMRFVQYVIASILLGFSPR